MNILFHFKIYAKHACHIFQYNFDLTVLARKTQHGLASSHLNSQLMFTIVFFFLSLTQYIIETKKIVETI